MIFKLHVLVQMHDCSYQPMFEDKKDNLFWMQTNHVILDGSEICEVQCFGDEKTNPNVGIDDACGPPTSEVDKGELVLVNLFSFTLLSTIVQRHLKCKLCS